jgi:outer membrane lipoprotein
MRIPLILTIPLLLLIAGCTHIISEKSREQADRSVKFSDVRHDPDAYRGKFVILGGVITGVRQNKEGVQLEVIQYPLDNEEMPDISAQSGGPFLVDLPSHVGYAMFKRGMVVTMAGEVKGKAVEPLGNAEYTYPVLVVREIHIIVRPQGGYNRGY